MEPILLRVEDVATLLGIARSTAYVLIAGGELPVVRIGRATRVPREAVEQWVRARTEEAIGADDRVIVGPWERSA
jgi:excisionase family DNA binding protein